MDLALLIAMVILATLAGGYLAASLILLKFPHLLHKKKKLKFRPTHISHRGGKFYSVSGIFVYTKKIQQQMYKYRNMIQYFFRKKKFRNVEASCMTFEMSNVL